MKGVIRAAFGIFMAVAAIYVVAAVSTYRWQNPERTETQLLLETPRALLWRAPPSD